MNFGLKQTVRVGDSLVLTQVFQPRIDDERFQQAPLLGRVLEDAPVIGTVSPPLLSHSFKRSQKGVSVGGLDSILDGYKHRPFVWSTSRVTIGAGQCMEGARSIPPAVCNFQRHVRGMAASAAAAAQK